MPVDHSNNNQIENYQQLSNFKKVLKRCMKDYAEDKGEEFDVFEFVGDFIGHTEDTVRKWFNPYDTTKTKLGADDLLKICILLRTDLPLRALHNDFKKFVPEKKDRNKNITDLKGYALRASKEVGDIAGAVERSLRDNTMDENERTMVQNEIDEAKASLHDLELKLKAAGNGR